ncbi:MAG: hypothetical protein A2Y62_20640 [Candidatus Fischerbacteria bacterium RBG_13_37_8]|uniref:Uncharacterized protein n=1 Tax=Candidatus Fischerbacteria bacterium RBG_13_37_8 TaxID=1817863 RepID=A0A1F5VEJ4_9BACT|nr:MAG: hypothetical protein A2Y62_20640 [Candidatus Fischerbacteria bacterium RBG_13_37_8]
MDNHSELYFSMIFEFNNGDGVVASLQYCRKRLDCINPHCRKKTPLSIKLDLSSFDKQKYEVMSYYPICSHCLYKNMPILAKYCS